MKLNDELTRSLASWLFYGPPRLPSGAYLSWVDRDNTGFVYPEAAALAIRTASWWKRATGDEAPLLQLIPTLQFLEQSVDHEGIVWHNSTAYLFDSVLVLAAFGEAAGQGMTGAYLNRMERMRETAIGMVARRAAASGSTSARWSVMFGPHLLKAIALLMRYGGPAAGQMHEDEETLVLAIHHLLSFQDDDGAFRCTEGNGGRNVYLHAHCYALEGLACLEALGRPEVGEPLRKGVAYLASQQRSDGGFPHWGDGRKTACDASAQAGRLFLIVEPERHKHRLDGIRTMLAGCIAKGAGVKYAPDVSHENSWCTAFTLQFVFGLTNNGLAPLDLV